MAKFERILFRPSLIRFMIPLVRVVKWRLDPSILRPELSFETWIALADPLVISKSFQTPLNPFNLLPFSKMVRNSTTLAPRLSEYSMLIMHDRKLWERLSMTVNCSFKTVGSGNNRWKILGSRPYSDEYISLKDLHHCMTCQMITILLSFDLKD